MTNTEPDSIVGILIERSVEMIVAMLAVLKAGGAYLPIDAEYPKERIEYILKDSNAKVLLSSKKLLDKINFQGEIVDLYDESLFDGVCTNLDNITNSSNLAYIIYTSGTTGKPKGVMIEHRNIINFNKGIIKETNITQYKNILCLTNITFDIFGLETIVPLLNGMEVVITSSTSYIGGEEISKIISKNAIEVMQVTPSRLRLFLGFKEFREVLKDIKNLFIGGDTLPIDLLKQLKVYENLKVYNVYGPTETSIYSTIKYIDNYEMVTIGKPIQNTNILILDSKNNIVPIGVIGEIYISGDGVGRGYLNNMQLTNEKFTLNPFDTTQRMYRTGDLGKWLPNGDIKLIGRIDNQVKVRGFRIELEDIENNLLSLENINEAVVLAEDVNEMKYLCAYYVGNKEYSIGELRARLMERLPEYMIPSYFIKVDKIPLNSNGKIDRKGFPTIDKNMLSKSKYIKAETSTERILVDIWKEVLGIDRVGVNDNFFEVGGNSFNTIQVVSNIKEKLSKDIDVVNIFRFPTIKLLASFIDNGSIEKESDENYKQRIEKVENAKNRLKNKSMKRNRK